MAGLVLFSGGWDSTCCLLVTPDPTALFLRYGQPYEDQEAKAVREITEVLGIPLIDQSVPSINMDTTGKFFNRNEKLLLHAASQYSGPVVLGCRNVLPMFDKFKDSNWVWARRMARVHGLDVRVPLVGWPKWLIRHRVSRAGRAVFDSVFSTEGFKPCIS